jgi:hypothetical protein
MIFVHVLHIVHKSKVDFLAATGLLRTAVLTFNYLPARTTCKTQLQNGESALQLSMVFAFKPTETPVWFPWFRHILHFLRS